MLYYIFNSDSSVLYKTIVKILKKADDEKYIKQLYLKMMYDVHMLAVDVSNNKNLLEDSSLDVPKTIIETVSNNSDRNIISLFINCKGENVLYIGVDNFMSDAFLKSLKLHLTSEYNKGMEEVWKSMPKFLSIEINLNKHFNIENTISEFKSTDFKSPTIEERKKSLLQFLKSYNPGVKINPEDIELKTVSLDEVKTVFDIEE